MALARTRVRGRAGGRGPTLVGDRDPRRYFTRNLQVAAGQTVVVDGPYEHLRHPSYTGAILMFAGVGIGLANALGLAACVVLPAIGFVRRIPREEALLRRELGEPYAEYASHTPRLLPGVW